MKNGIAVCLFMLLILTSCSQIDRTNINEPSAEVDSQFSYPKTKMLLDWTPYDTDAYTLRTNYLLMNEGYNIDFEIPKIEIGTGVNIRDEYRDILKEKLAQPNYVAIVRYSVYQFLHTEGVLADITSIAESVSPEFLSKASTVMGGNDMKNAIPATIDEYRVPSKKAVQIKREIREQYALPITSATEYEAFLVWAKDTYPDLIPGNIPIKKYMLAYGGSPLDDLFLPEYGITPIDSMIGGIVSLCVYNKDLGTIYASEELPEYFDAYQRLSSWIDSGLVKITSLNSADLSDDKFASKVVDIREYTSSDLLGIAGRENVNDNQNDSEYSIDILYPKDYVSIDDDTPRFFLVAGKSADPNIVKEALRLVSSIDNTQDLHDMVLFGEESIDYTVDKDGRVTSLSNNQQSSNPALCLASNKYMQRFVPTSAPINYREQIKALSPAVANRQLHELITNVNTLMQNDVQMMMFQNVLSSRQRKYFALLSNISASLPITNDDFSKWGNAEELIKTISTK